ncbi:ATP-dependent dethiobiotin synthetase BioD [Chlorobium phaeovibrioides]|uniref:ATP-dependent dethiobiotin synthetase BioD n=2 Tax=Chlorobium phaeovibrioides TaxID=1094 RepID=A0A3S0L1S7_CHLPH|nr:dethiobiotin synthase [Chlorobium phaeovibrioides]MWV54234.1 ATP-dependent dethiobiotin synthetase BioD [Chlorobium phaeovibrioides]RTY36650.1 ATP-dependent dethiobiotin synthetase BioD [Chlorobium phaeovibrioides]RTY39429.1 ATP-dependent dethiobiotin synthetase BioD [Chlorobium phaeovibrioides]HCD35786.1 ATP-dependent dethiobiotin synthetase BioD [Chlorobium sp.]
MNGRLTVVSGIDTGVGKTAVTGLLAASLLHRGVRVMTSKTVQTGCTGIADDIVEHRRLMGIPLEEADRLRLTCPQVFPLPASPHLAARMAGSEVDLAGISASVNALLEQYDEVLLEGVGGLLVPLSPDMLFLDYVKSGGWDLLLVATPRLGSINHTLLSVEACLCREVPLRGIIYNRFGEHDPLIAEDSLETIRRELSRRSLSLPVIDFRSASFHRTDLEQLGFLVPEP